MYVGCVASYAEQDPVNQCNVAVMRATFNRTQLIKVYCLCCELFLTGSSQSVYVSCVWSYT